MSAFRRYAIYHAPRPGRLAAFGARWLGWDAEAGSEVAPLRVEGLPRPHEEIVASARRYGFHATIKPPMRLVAGSSRAALEADLARLAARLAPVAMDGLALGELDDFVALRPEGDPTALAALAGEVVRRLDHHRAPADDTERARRRSGGLGPVEEENLMLWGYPFLFEAFRFHFTLTGPLTTDERRQVKQVLGPLLAPLLPRPFILDSLSLFGEDADGWFHHLKRFPLTG